MEIGWTEQRTVPDPEREVSPTEVDRQALAMGQRAFAVIQPFLARQIELDELIARLREIDSAGYLARHWRVLTSRPEAAPALELLQLIAFLPDQAGYQVARYGASSIADDRDQLVSAMRRIGRAHEGRKAAAAASGSTLGPDARRGEQ